MTTTTVNPVQESTPDADTPQIVSPRANSNLVAGTATEVRIRAGKHRFVIDEPEALGGTDKGANPVEHLLAALGACQVITYQVWAEKLGLRIDSIDVETSGDLDIRGFYGLKEGVRPGFQSIRFEARIAGPETDESYRELVRLVDEHCPVLDTITAPVTATGSFVRA